MARNVPAAEFDVTVDLVRGLLEDQHPDLVGLPLDVVANGWDNAILRLGDDMAVRLPRRRLGADLVVHEQAWLPALADRLPIPIPAPVRTGGPGRGFPWSWSIVPWFRGEVAAESELDDPTREAERLGWFVRILHDTPAESAPSNQFRGFPVATLDERFDLTTAVDLDRPEPNREPHPSHLRVWAAMEGLGDTVADVTTREGDPHYPSIVGVARPTALLARRHGLGGDDVGAVRLGLVVGAATGDQPDIAPWGDGHPMDAVTLEEATGLCPVEPGHSLALPGEPRRTVRYDS